MSEMMMDSIMKLSQRLIPVSMLSQGKASQIVNEVYKKNLEYIILKNNQPKAVLISFVDYEQKIEKLEKYEALIEEIENEYLLSVAEKRKGQPMTSFQALIDEEGMTLDELQKLAETVEIE